MLRKASNRSASGAEMTHCRRLLQDSLDFAPDADGIDALMVGKQLADEWKMAPGDYVTITSPQGRLTPFGLIPRTRRYRVAGVFDSGFYDYDENWCFLTLHAAQSLAGTADVVNVLEFRLDNPESAREIASRAEQLAGQDFLATSWMEQNFALFRALRLEKLVTAIFIGLITFVAGLNILVVLSMMVTDKARDIAVLMSMGTRREQIRKIFLWQGIAIGFTGTLIGLCVGYAFALDCGNLSSHSTRSTNLCGFLCAVSSQRARWRVDHAGGDGDFDWSDDSAGAGSGAAIAGRDSPL